LKPVWGKLLGTIAGLATGKPWLALIGLLLGHQFDRGFAERLANGRDTVDDRTLKHVPQYFTSALFRVMGHVAKADGRVTEQEINAARETMRRFALGEADVRRAIDLFTEGKSADFPLDDVIGEFRNASTGREDLRRLFVQIQLEAALIGGGLSAPSRAVFARICNALGISAIEFAALEAMLRMRGQQGPGAAAQPAAARLADAYQVLGVTPETADAKVTLAYRRLMSQNHPDKLVANGLPQSMIEAAHERTRRILEAYEVIRNHRGMK
jgi:DnaJ like chaperone protein